MTSYFPDVNVWLALTHDRHVHYQAAANWLQQIREPVLFCRFTQIAVLRLLTTESVMGRHVLTQRQAWRAYHEWFEDERVGFQHEPDSSELERRFEEFSDRNVSAAKLWGDAYLAAVAATVGLMLVTFDRGLAAITPSFTTLLPSP